MESNEKWIDETLKEIVENKGYPEMKWEDFAPQVQYAVKTGKAKQHLIDLLCQHYTKDEADQLMRDWNHETQPLLEPDDVQKILDDLWRRYDGLYLLPISKMDSVLFKSDVANWGELAWNKLLDYMKDAGALHNRLSKAMEKHVSAVDEGATLRDLLGGYFLIANREAPGYIIQAVFDDINEIASPPPNIANGNYDSEGHTLIQALTLDMYIQELCADPLLFIDVFKVQDTQFIRDICMVLNLLAGLLEVEFD